MTMNYKMRVLSGAVSVLAWGGLACAQPAPPAGPPPVSAEFLAHLRAEEARFNASPDMPGTGPYPAVKEELASLPDHVVYRPADLSRVAPHSLPILVWGNGGCAADGAGGRYHLSQIVSHGYLAIANGRIFSGPGAHPKPEAPAPAGGGLTIPPPETNFAQLKDAIDWAIREDARPGSPLHGKLNTAAIAVSGWSCGGLQALQLATSDPRIKAVIIHNSGIFPGETPMKGMAIGKGTLERLHTPILYVLGGPSDIAYANGMDDYRQITRVPAVVANLGNVGHGGSFTQPNGGKAAMIDIAWLDWQLKGDQAASRQFMGEDCGLCKDSDWAIQKKGW